MGKPPCPPWPHLKLITFQRSHLQILSLWGLGLQHQDWAAWETQTLSVTSRQPEHRSLSKSLLGFLTAWWLGSKNECPERTQQKLTALLWPRFAPRLHHFHHRFLFGAALRFHPKRWQVKESEVAQLCPALCNPMNCSLPGSSVHGIFQARILHWVAIFFSRGSSWPRDWNALTKWEQVDITQKERYVEWSTLSFQLWKIQSSPVAKVPSRIQ